jgi:hypothetical protein
VILGRVVVACTSKVLRYPADCDFSKSQFCLVAGQFRLPGLPYPDTLIRITRLAS